EGDAKEQQAPDANGTPIAVLGVGQADEDRYDAGSERQDARVVDVARRVRPPNRRQQPGDHGHSDEPDGQVDVEDPVPAEVVGEGAAKAGANQEGDPEDRPEQALVLAALAGREQVTD